MEMIMKMITITIVINDNTSSNNLQLQQLPLRFAILSGNIAQSDFLMFDKIKRLPQNGAEQMVIASQSIMYYVRSLVIYLLA